MTRRAALWLLAGALQGCSLEGFADGAGGLGGSAGDGGSGSGTGGGPGSGGTGGACRCDCEAWSAIEVSSGGPASAPVVAWTGSEWAVAWHDARDGNTEIYFARLDEAGALVGPPLRVTTDPADSLAPALVWTGQAHALAWEDTRSGKSSAYLAFLDGVGTKTFGDALVWGGTGAPHAPAMGWSNAAMSLVLTWQDFRDGGLKLFTGNVGADGAVIHAEERITDPPTGDARDAAMAASGSEYGVVWQDTRDGDEEIYFRRVDGGGYPIGVETRVTDAAGGAQQPAIAWSDGAYALAWADAREGMPAIWFATLSDGGALRAAEQQVSSGSGPSTAPSLVRGVDEHAIAWQEGDADGSQPIRFRRVDLAGAPLGGEAPVAGEKASHPSLAWSGSAFGLAWQDRSSGEPRVWFARCAP
jgi:hypothetical protein